MIIRLIVVCTRYNVTMEIQCHKDTECVVSDETIEIKVASDKVRNKIKEFCKFTKVSVKEYPIIHKLVIPKNQRRYLQRPLVIGKAFQSPIGNKDWKEQHSASL